MRELAKEWLNKADEDFLVAEREFTAKPPACSAVCFHAQQAVEKAIKALLIEFAVEFPKTHDLKFLLNLTKTKTTAFSGLEKRLTELSIYAVEVRYPGSQPDKKRAKESISAMRAFFKKLKNVLSHL